MPIKNLQLKKIDLEAYSYSLELKSSLKIRPQIRTESVFKIKFVFYNLLKQAKQLSCSKSPLITNLKDKNNWEK